RMCVGHVTSCTGRYARRGAGRSPGGVNLRGESYDAQVTSAPSGTAPPARGVRRELAEGDALTRYAPGAPHALRFDSRLAWDGWRARVDGDHLRATFPGTAVQVDGAWYEVRRIERIGERWAYYLDAWEEQFPLREPRELSADACRR